MAHKLNLLSLLWICLLVPLAYCDGDTENVFALFGKSTVLRCTLEPTEDIEWYDWVYNLVGDSPAQVYKDGIINDDEYHKGRFWVDPQTSHLNISRVQEDDVGIYFCKTATGRQEFELTVGRMPACQGKVSGLFEADQTKLQCEMEYSGVAPKLEWLREEEILDETADETIISKAKLIVDVDVEAGMNAQTFTCRAVVGDIVEECSLTFDVKYTTRDLMITPEKESYGPGSEFACSAKGNPAPMLKATLPDGEVKEAANEVKVVIPEEWKGMTKSVICEASNIVQNVPVQIVRNFTFAVSLKPDEGAATGDGEDGKDGDKGKKTQLAGIIAGLVIGAVVLVIIIVAVVCIKRRQSKPPKGSKPVSTKEDVKDDVRA